MNGSLRKIVALSIVAFTLAAISALPALASKDNPPIYLTLSNDYIRFCWGLGNTVNFKYGDTSYTYDVVGRYSITSVDGDPESVDDDNFDLVPTGHDFGDDYDNGWAPCHKFGYIKVKVGNNTPSIIGISGGSWTKEPSVYLPPNGLGLGKNGRFMEGIWTTTENIQVTIDVYLVRDQVRWEFNLKNLGTTGQTVGLQIHGAARNYLNGISYDKPNGSGFTTGQVFMPGTGQLLNGKVFSGTTLPDYVEKMNHISNPTIVARHTLKGQDAVKPDRIAFGDSWDIDGYTGVDATDSTFSDAETEMWLEPHTGYPSGSYVPDPRVQEPNQGWAVCWDRKNVAAGATRKIVTYYGIGAADTTWTVQSGTQYDFDSAALAVQGLRTIQYDSTDAANLNELSPSTFDVKAYVDNLATDLGVYDLQNIQVSLILPDGLSLVSGRTTQTLGYVKQNTEVGPATWTVQADGNICGPLEYYVRAQDTVTGWNQITSRKVLVPAIGFGKFVSGWQLASVPFTFTDKTPNNVFQKDAGQIFPQYWNIGAGGTGSYKTLTSVTPGQGFWVYATGLGVGEFQIAADKQIYGGSTGTQADALNIDLKPGWNLVGNPYVYPIYWGQVQFYNKTTNLALPLDKAVTSGWISSTIFTWNASKKKYDYYSTAQATLDPYKAYWIRAKKTVTMVVTPTQFPGGKVTVAAN